MKNFKIIFTSLCLLAGFACQPDDVMQYDSPDNIYFDFDDVRTNDRDSLVFSFAYTPEVPVDTVWLPIAVSGKRVAFDRNFKVEIIEETTTAEVELHYEPLKEHYTIPADSGKMRLPVILYNRDPELSEKAVSIYLKLTEGPDFGIYLPHLLNAKVVFSNRLEKPIWWDQWFSNLSTYSRVKHELYLIAVGNEDLLESTADGAMEVPRTLYLIDKFSRFIRNPLGWVEENTDGYELEANEDGSYYFFNSANPDKKFLIRLHAADGNYYFIDENDLRVTVN